MTSSHRPPMGPPGFALGLPRIISSTSGRSLFGQRHTWELFHDHVSTGLYFAGVKHDDDGTIHQVGLFTHHAFKPHRKTLGLPAHWDSMDCVTAGLSWEWAGAYLEHNQVPIATSNNETLLEVLAHDFQNAIASMTKTNGHPHLDGWLSPIAAAVLVRLGWPLSVPTACAWLEAHALWDAHRQIRAQIVPAVSREQHPDGTVWAKEADGHERSCLNFECIAQPERDFLLDNELFDSQLLTACQTILGQTPSKKRTP